MGVLAPPPPRKLTKDAYALLSTEVAKQSAAEIDQKEG